MPCRFPPGSILELDLLHYLALWWVYELNIAVHTKKRFTELNRIYIQNSFIFFRCDVMFEFEL